MYAIGEEGDSLDLYRELSLDLLALFKKNDFLIKFLGNNHIHRQDRKELIDELFKGKMDQLFLNGLKLLIDDNLFYGIGLILKRLIKQVNNSHNVQYGTAYSVIPLTPEQIKSIEEKASRRFKHTVILRNKIEEGIIGGVRLESRNYVIDGSLSGELVLLRRKVLINK